MGNADLSFAIAFLATDVTVRTLSVAKQEGGGAGRGRGEAHLGDQVELVGVAEGHVLVHDDLSFHRAVDPQLLSEGAGVDAVHGGDVVLLEPLRSRQESDPTQHHRLSAAERERRRRFSFLSSNSSVGEGTGKKEERVDGERRYPRRVGKGMGMGKPARGSCRCSSGRGRGCNPGR